MTLMDSHLLLGMIEIEVHICAQWFKSVVFEPLKVFSVYHGNVGIFFLGGGGCNGLHAFKLTDPNSV